MRTMADALGDLGEGVTNRTLILNIVRGLNEDLQHISGWIIRQKPIPPYDEVVADLRIKEMTSPGRLH